MNSIFGDDQNHNDLYSNRSYSGIPRRGQTPLVNGNIINKGNDFQNLNVYNNGQVNNNPNLNINQNNNQQNQNTYQNNNHYGNEYNANNLNSYTNQNQYGQYNNYINGKNSGKENNYYASQIRNYIPDNTKMQLKSVIRFFAIVLIIFGIILIGEGAYAINKSKPKESETPRVSLEKMGSKVDITISSIKPIQSIKYNWNSDSPTTINGNGTITFEKSLLIPNGNNILHLYIYDYYGSEHYYNNQYIRDNDDSTEPTIELQASGKNILISVSDDTQLDYFTYKWNEDKETRIEAQEGDKASTTEIPVVKGNNTLTVTAYDKAENRGVKSQQIIGSDAPDIILSTENSKLIIKATDEINIKNVEVTIDGQLQDVGEIQQNQKQISLSVPLTIGNHKIKVIVTNTGNITQTKEMVASI